MTHWIHRSAPLLLVLSVLLVCGAGPATQPAADAQLPTAAELDQVRQIFANVQRGDASKAQDGYLLIDKLRERMSAGKSHWSPDGYRERILADRQMMAAVKAAGDTHLQPWYHECVGALGSSASADSLLASILAIQDCAVNQSFPSPKHYDALLGAGLDRFLVNNSRGFPSSDARATLLTWLKAQGVHSPVIDKKIATFVHQGERRQN